MIDFIMKDVIYQYLKNIEHEDKGICSLYPMVCAKTCQIITRQLISAGLVEMKMKQGRTIPVSITDKGRKILILMQKIRNLINQDMVIKHV